MLIAVTGATGFLGRYIVRHLVSQGHRTRCWRRPASDCTGFDAQAAGIEWIAGSLNDASTFAPLCRGVDAVVHAALHRPGGRGFRASASESLDDFVRTNLRGTLSLMDTARRLCVPRFVFISTCAVHEVILPDRPLDETHPLWPTSHYGAHKAAIETFVHSFGLGEGWNACALRPTGIYGLAHPASKSRWHDIVRRVARGEPYVSDAGGKEVHAADVARATALLLAADADRTRGQAFNCYDLYVAERRVAEIARELTGSRAEIGGRNAGPRNQIDTTKIRALGMEFGGEALLRRTVGELLSALRDA